MRANTSNSSDKVNALLPCLDLLDDLSNGTDLRLGLNTNDVDTTVDGLNQSIVNISSSAVIVAQPSASTADGFVGVSFTRTLNESIVLRRDEAAFLQSDITGAGIIRNSAAYSIDFIAILILAKYSLYQTVDRSRNQTVVSPVIVATASQTGNPVATVIDLYLRDLTGQPRSNGEYLCSFFDASTSRWNESGCSKPRYNSQYNRHECTCDHQTTFALLWLPLGSISNNLDAQDIASLAFLATSILSFIVVIGHSLIARLVHSVYALEARNALPLISSATTALLFVFYIALSLTVYTHTATPYPTSCFPSASILMFIVYFLALFMFGCKTTVGVSNYIQFVQLFSDTSYRKLSLMLIGSLCIAVVYSALAIGFNTNPSYHITQLYSNKLCWFTRDAIHYFFTIPVCLFLACNFVLIVLIGKHIFGYARKARSAEQWHVRRKRCLLVLTASCVTQGIGWALGPLISVLHPTAGYILGWGFVICNGLEGVWTIVLYSIIRSQQIDESKRTTSNSNLVKTIPRFPQ